MECRLHLHIWRVFIYFSALKIWVCCYYVKTLLHSYALLNDWKCYLFFFNNIFRISYILYTFVPSKTFFFLFDFIKPLTGKDEISRLEYWPSPGSWGRITCLCNTLSSNRAKKRREIFLTHAYLSRHLFFIIIFFTTAWCSLNSDELRNANQRSSATCWKLMQGLLTWFFD